MSNDRQKRAARAEQMRKEREKADRKQRNLISIGIVVVVVALIGVATWGISSVSSDNEKQTEVVAPANATDDFGVVYDTAAAGGTPAADTEPVSVELYEDFQCPACQQFEAASGSFLKDKVASGEITITYRPFSFLDENGASPNEYSHRSTNLAMCALDTGGVADYVTIHDMLYANQPAEQTAGPENDELIDAAAGVGVTVDEECMRTENFFPWIDEAKNTASEDRGVSGTPTVYIGGEVSEARTPDQLQAAIDAAAAA